MEKTKTNRDAWSAGYPWAAKGDGVPTPETLERLEAAAIAAFGTLLGAVPDSMKGPGTETDRALERFGAAFFGAKREVARMEFLRDGTRDVLESMTDETFRHMLRAMETLPETFGPGGACRGASAARKASALFKI